MKAEADGTLDAGATPVSRRLGVATLYMLLGNAFTLIVGLPLQIYVARVLGASGIGVYGVLEAVMATVAGLAGLGIGQTAMRFLPDHMAHGEYQAVRALLRIGGLMLLAIGVTAYLVLLAALPWLGNFWPDVTPYRFEIAAMGLMIPMGLLIYFLQQSLRGLQDIRHVVLGSSVMQLSVKALLTVVAFAIGLRLDGYILASLLGTATGLLWLFYHVQSRARALPAGRAAASTLASWRRYAAISYSGALIGAAVVGLDRFLVGAFIGSSTVGVLVVARQLQNFPDRFNQMLLMIGAPLLSAAHARQQHGERQHIFFLMTDWSVRCAMPLVLFLLLFGRQVLALYGTEFAARGTLPLQILVAASCFGLLCGPVGNVALMSGLERKVLQLSIIETGLVLVMLIVSIPAFGLVGAALSIAFGVVSLNSAVTLLVWQKLGLRWWDSRYLAWLPEAGANLLLALPVLYVHPQLDAAELVVLLAAMYALAILVGVAFGLHDDDRELLRYIWGRLKR